MINHQRDTYQWEFVFLGANQNAIQAGAMIGIRAGSAMTYASNQVGTPKAFAAVARGVTKSRHKEGLVSDYFSEDDRKEQTDAGAVKS